MILNLYPVQPEICFIRSATRTRDWMKDIPHVYKCSPVTNCNSFGWDLLLSKDVEFEWEGGNAPSSLKVTNGNSIAMSNFGNGIITFAPGFTWQTEPNWSLMFMPVPNYLYKDIQPMSAVVETDKLKYPVHVSAHVHKPGKYTLKKYFPFCRILPVQIGPVVECQPMVKNEPQEFAEYRAWQKQERNKFVTTNEYRENKTWQKFYLNIIQNRTIKTKEPIT